MCRTAKKMIVLNRSGKVDGRGNFLKIILLYLLYHEIVDDQRTISDGTRHVFNFLTFSHFSLREAANAARPTRVVVEGTLKDKSVCNFMMCTITT